MINVAQIECRHQGPNLLWHSISNIECDVKQLVGFFRDRQEYTKIFCGKVRITNYTKHVFHLFIIRVKYRFNLQNYLKENGIATGIQYPTPLPFLKAYDNLEHKTEEFPVGGI